MKRPAAGISRILLPVLCVLLLAPAVSRAQPPARPTSDGGPASNFEKLVHQIRFVARFLDLSEEQAAATRSLLEQLRTDLQPLLEQRHALSVEIHDALEAESPDPTAIGTLVIARHEATDQAAALRQTFLADFEALLTPEQRDLFERLRNAIRERPGRRGAPAEGVSLPGL